MYEPIRQDILNKIGSYHHQNSASKEMPENFLNFWSLKHSRVPCRTLNLQDIFNKIEVLKSINLSNPAVKFN